MKPYAYEGVDPKEIHTKRFTSEGKGYTLAHSPSLIVDMRYIGDDKSNANSQGWERSSKYYFNALKNQCPEAFSKKNSYRIEHGEAPRVDRQFIDSFPQYKGFANEQLIHHHIGKDGQAVALPQSIHKGSGEIHVYEDRLGITDNAQKFSSQCCSICNSNPSMLNKTKDEYLNYQNRDKKCDNAITKLSKKQSGPSASNSRSNIPNSTKTNSIKSHKELKR